jgi:hypothetical protein
MEKHDALINRLYSDEADRKLARAFASHFGGLPGMDDRVSALLEEAARSAENVGGGAMTPEQAWNYLRDYAATIGTPPHAMAGFDTWFDATSAEFAAAEAPTQPAAEPAQQQPQPTATPARARQAAPPPLAGPTRESLQAEIAKHQANMRAPEGSAEWRSYWREGGSAQYLAALQALEVADAAPPPMPPPGAAAPAPAQPAPATEPAAPGA